MKKYIIGIALSILSVVSLGANGKYLVTGVEFKNLKEIPANVLVQRMTLKKGAIFTPEKLAKDYNSINSSGYVEKLTITPETTNGGIKLVVDVKEKSTTRDLLEKRGIIPASEKDNPASHIRVASVEILGNVNVNARNISNKIPIKSGNRFSRNKIIEGQRALLETGLYKEVIPDVYQYPEGLVVVYSVVENPIVRDVRIIGNTAYSTNDLNKLVKVKKGKVLNINELRETSSAIVNKYNKDGYVLAKIADVNLTNKNEVEITVTEGKIGSVSYSKMITKERGERRTPLTNVFKTQDYVVERELDIQPGELFNINNYNRTSSNLIRTGNFKNVKYEESYSSEDPTMLDLNLVVEEERTASLQGAISYGSESGLMGMLTIKDTNWRGKGQELGMSFEKSDEDYSSFSIDFSDPWIRDTDRISWGWSLYRKEYKSDDSVLFNETETYGGRINVGKGLNRNVRLSLGAKAEYINEKADSSYDTWVENYPTIYSEYGKERDFMLYSIYPSVTYDSRDSYLNPTKGFYAKYQIEVGHADTVNSGAFANTSLELRTYHRGITKNNTFAYRIVGAIMTEETPESQRYYVGGGSTLRGYDGGYYQGTTKLTASFENRTQLGDVIGFVLFADVGRAWDYKGVDPGYILEGRDKEFGEDISLTAGVGLRVNTPVGPLRFDFGWPINDDDEKDMKFYFNMGQSF